MVLDCFLVEEDRHPGSLAGSRTTVEALLVLRQVPVLDDGSLEAFTDFQGGTLAKDNPPVTFEASGKSPPPYVSIFLGSLRWDGAVPEDTHRTCFPWTQVFSIQLDLCAALLPQ